MSRSIDVRNEVRRLASSKPVHAAAGAGVAASQALRELPARLSGWSSGGPGAARTRAGELTARAGQLTVRTNSYVRSARARAAHRYDSLAARGRKLMNGHAVAGATRSPNGKSK